MKTELFKAFKSINIEELDNSDKEELLQIFTITKNDLIRNHLALIFSDLHYNNAIPFIIKKINDKSTLHNNGTLVYSLENLDTKQYFIEFIKMICKLDYEARLMAYGSIQQYASSISNQIRAEALKILEDCRRKLEQEAIDKGENSTLHFVEKTKELLQKHV